ncbi:MAG: YggS family pyridoxal phosphate-dependent enzyme [Bacteroidales bacterium]|nr:YggS family pyridoxal phosphate-dependent enzyme [Bacteroidales bacterium]
MIEKVIHRLKSELPATVKLVAVSKFHPFESIEEAYRAGQRIFAESRPQELASKVRALEARRIELDDPGYMSDIEWHFIGHLQTNKLKLVLPYVSLVQSVDSVRLLDAMDSWGRTSGCVVNVLLEPHVAAEDTKQGFEAEEVKSILQAASRGEYKNIRFKGIMGMATFTDDENVIRSDFASLLRIYEDSLSEFPSVSADFQELSIGMSDDYSIAVEYGSTMVRIGSMIFGLRKI